MCRRYHIQYVCFLDPTCIPNLNLHIDVMRIGEMGKLGYSPCKRTILTVLQKLTLTGGLYSEFSPVLSFVYILESCSPPKIKSIRIVENPFDDIVPRITAAEKRAQQRARDEAQREREEMERRKGAKKCVDMFWVIPC